MEFQDKTLKCTTCGREFFFTAREQEFYQEKNFLEPKHCRECRQQRKLRRETYAREPRPGGETRLPRSISVVICAECGKPTQVPFKPLTGKPILCRDCFIQKRISSESNEAESLPIGMEPKPPESDLSDRSESTEVGESIVNPELPQTVPESETDISNTTIENMPTTEPTDGTPQDSPSGDTEDTAIEPKE